MRLAIGKSYFNTFLLVFFTTCIVYENCGVFYKHLLLVLIFVKLYVPFVNIIELEICFSLPITHKIKNGELFFWGNFLFTSWYRTPIISCYKVLINSSLPGWQSLRGLSCVRLLVFQPFAYQGYKKNNKSHSKSIENIALIRCIIGIREYLTKSSKKQRIIAHLLFLWSLLLFSLWIYVL